jgi:NTP pyrophosphatase (non-canonical NTP hydrolase)
MPNDLDAVLSVAAPQALAVTPAVEVDKIALDATRDIRDVGDNMPPSQRWARIQCIVADAIRKGSATPAVGGEPFQKRVHAWMMECFSMEICRDRQERNHRFIEEALELVQACGCTASEAHQLVDYVYGRDQGDINQEVGGVMVTLAALCLANDIDMHSGGETELARVWTKIDQIRAKQAGKPKHSPLPQSVAAPPASPLRGVTDEMVSLACEVYAEVYRDDDKDMGDAMRAALKTAFIASPPEQPAAAKALCARLRAMPSSLNDACRMMEEAASWIEAQSEPKETKAHD